MSRQISVDDFVIITQQGFATATYVIRQIDQNSIYVSSNANPDAFSLIIPDQMGRWKIHGSDAIYDIQFQANLNVAIQPIGPISPTQTATPTTTLSGMADVDLVILSRLDDISLTAACRTNKYIASLCRSDILWRHKVEYRFPGAEKYKEKGI